MVAEGDPDKKIYIASTAGRCRSTRPTRTTTRSGDRGAAGELDPYRVPPRRESATCSPCRGTSSTLSYDTPAWALVVNPTARPTRPPTGWRRLPSRRSRESRETGHTDRRAAAARRRDAGGHGQCALRPVCRSIETTYERSQGGWSSAASTSRCSRHTEASGLLNIAGLHDRAPPHRGQARGPAPVTLPGPLPGERGFDAVHVQGINTALPFLALPAAHRLASPRSSPCTPAGTRAGPDARPRAQWRALGHRSVGVHG